MIKGHWIAVINNNSNLSGFIALDTPELNQFVNDLKIGNTLRIKLNFPKIQKKNDIYLNYSLSGSGDAITRAVSLCERNRDPDKQYFEEQAIEKLTPDISEIPLKGEQSNIIFGY
ncbi:hypothetical protein TAO_0187 [Candidatus Nitrosoglobus terrae]|uniref:Uncharacterized protein n=1 Tax=Candidatus Nitrosoglobus terrae TaxID=1630141 RepID=A0A1Q2SKB7_9GAMM|nr:hypothetical protein [Candidatus Nitrosoglobus terrae]BAW79557.1 hypothetical protein TAO_0187 [Candidatus Nitrosoglobus terrae]